MKLIFIALMSMAIPPQQWIPWPQNGTVYLDPSLCPDKCYPLVNGVGQLLDPDVVVLSGGGLAEDSGLKKAKSDSQAASSQAILNKQIQLKALATKLNSGLGNTADKDQAIILMMQDKYGN